MKNSEFELVRTTRGVWSIKSLITQEIMHNPVGPWEEANNLYILPSGLKEKLQKARQDSSLLSGLEAQESRKTSPGEYFDLEHRDDRPLVLFDVGLGAAANSLSAVTLFESLSDSRPLTIYSFESNLRLLDFALQCADYFPHIHSHRGHLRALLDNGEYFGGNLKWKLLEGDFNDTVTQAPEEAEVIYFDPYSPKTNPEMWGIETFEKLGEKMRSAKNGGSLLLTYSQSTRVRSAMITAGLFVGYGPSTGLKEATTQASNRIELLTRPLEKNWYQRWKSSHARYPMGCIDRHWQVDNAVRTYFEELQNLD